jgi:hypothetical protein
VRRNPTCYRPGYCLSKTYMQCFVSGNCCGNSRFVWALLERSRRESQPLLPLPILHPSRCRILRVVAIQAYPTLFSSYEDSVAIQMVGIPLIPATGERMTYACTLICIQRLHVLKREHRRRWSCPRPLVWPIAFEHSESVQRLSGGCDRRYSRNSGRQTNEFATIHVSSHENKVTIQ